MAIGLTILVQVKPALAEEPPGTLDELRNLRLELSRTEMEKKVLEMKKEILELEQEASISQAELENELSRIRKMDLRSEEAARRKAEASLSAYQKNLILPGWGHYSRGNKNKAYLYGGLFLTSLTYTAYSIHRTEGLGQRVSEFDALDPLSIKSRNRFENSRQESAVLIGITVLIYGLVLTDPLEWSGFSDPWTNESMKSDTTGSAPSILQSQSLKAGFRNVIGLQEDYQTLFYYSFYL